VGGSPGGGAGSGSPGAAESEKTVDDGHAEAGASDDENRSAGPDPDGEQTGDDASDPAAPIISDDVVDVSIDSPAGVPTEVPKVPTEVPVPAPETSGGLPEAEVVLPAAGATTVGAADGVVEGVPEVAPDPRGGVAAAAAKRPLPRALAIANQKGGVGKTTTAVNLGAGLAELGYRVLIVDLDPQGNATTGLGVNSRNLQASVYDVLLNDMPLEDCVEATSVRNLFVAPATIDLAGAEIELVPAFSRELKLRRAFERVGDDYDYILVDCPPSLGLLTVNAMAAAGEVLVPIQCEYYALEGLGQLLRNVQLVQSNLNPKLEVSAIVLTMYDARTKLADQVAREVRQHFGDKVCRNVVPRTVRLSEAPSFGQPIIVFDPTSRGALAYRELAKEVSGGAPQRTG